MGTAPPFTRILPAASRLVTMVLSSESPNSVRMPEPAEKLALTAMVANPFGGNGGGGLIFVSSPKPKYSVLVCFFVADGKPQATGAYLLALRSADKRQS